MSTNDTKPKMKIAMRYLGILSMVIGGLLLLGFLQGADPDCYLAETESNSPTFLRMCGGFYTEFGDIIWWPLLASVITLITGFALIKFSKQKPSE